MKSEGIKSITYTVVYTGTEILPETPEDPAGFKLTSEHILMAAVILLALLLIGLLIFLFLRRKNVYVYVPGDKPRDYKLIAKFRVDPKYPSINLCEVDPYPTGTVAIELKRSIAKKLEGKEFHVHCANGAHTYTVLQSKPGDWHEFDVDTLATIEEVPT